MDNPANWTVAPFSFALGALITWVALWMGQPLARRIGLLDRPGKRKIHQNQTPLIGGACMYIGLVPALYLMAPPLPQLDAFVLSLTLLMVVGLADDYWELSVAFRFAAQIAAGLIMTWASGVTVASLGDLVGLGPAHLGGAEIVFTVICVVGVINAVNMVDGLDGLAGGLSLVTLGFVALLAWHGGERPVAGMAGALIAVIIPFLYFNGRFFGRPAAALFMGDAGSTFLGFTLAWFMVFLTQGEHRVMQPVTALWLVAVPLIDMFSAFLRRLLKKQQPFAADRRHYHHLLLHLGFSVNQTVLILMGVAVAAALFGLSGDWLGVAEYWMFLAIFIVFGLSFASAAKTWRREESGVD